MATVLILVACKDDDRQPAVWNIYPEPVFKGQFPLTGDPSVMKDENMYRMFYTTFDAARNPQGPEIAQATSSDGIHWTNVDVNDAIEGRMLYTGSNSWSTAHETCFIKKIDAKYYLYFTGYKDNGKGIFFSGPASVGLALSNDGVNFSQAQHDPVIVPGPGLLDKDILSSPTITNYKDSLVMIYAGICVGDCGATANLMAVTSKDGRTWVKRKKPVIDRSEVLWASRGIAEAEIVLTPSGDYCLFMTSVNEPHVIGVAAGPTPFGPWKVTATLVIGASQSFSTDGAVAPSVLIENGTVKVWYSGFSGDQIQIGYAEASWPLKFD